METTHWTKYVAWLAVYVIAPSTILFADTNTQDAGPGPFANRIKYLVIHHTHVRASTNSRQVDSVNHYHRERFDDRSYTGKCGGYNWFIDVSGTLTQFRLVGEKTAAQLAHNFDSESICMAGNFNIDMPTKAQIKVLCSMLYDRPNLIIVFHRDLADRTCPGTNLTKDWLKRALATNRAKDSPKLTVHTGNPNLRASDYTLIAREHAQNIQMYRELANNNSDIANYQRNKLEKIIERQEGRRTK